MKKYKTQNKHSSHYPSFDSTPRHSLGPVTLSDRGVDESKLT
jgi:hypothetical protein